MGKDTFWDKVKKCDHNNISPNYYESISCPTPYCQGYESYCLDCKVYIIECGCKYLDGMSGWPDKRHNPSTVWKTVGGK